MKTVDKWHKTRAGLLVFALVELLLAYAAASWAVDSGNLLLYAATLILVLGSVHNLVKLLGTFIHGNRQAN